MYEAVANRTVTHSGDPRLARHVANAVVKTDSGGIRIQKDGKHSARRIDLAVCCVHGALGRRDRDRAAALLPRRRRVGRLPVGMKFPGYPTRQGQAGVVLSTADSAPEPAVLLFRLSLEMPFLG